jgi:TRAP-type mannitol/chloroaromatic compound transport system permease small subunit
MDAFANFLGGVVVAILAFGAWKIAYESVVELEMRIGVFRFPIWPFRIVFALGLTLLAVQFLSNSIRCILQIRNREYTAD